MLLTSVAVVLCERHRLARTSCVRGVVRVWSHAAARQAALGRAVVRFAVTAACLSRVCVRCVLPSSIGCGAAFALCVAARVRKPDRLARLLVLPPPENEVPHRTAPRCHTRPRALARKCRVRRPCRSLRHTRTGVSSGGAALKASPATSAPGPSRSAAERRTECHRLAVRRLESTKVKTVHRASLQLDELVKQYAYPVEDEVAKMYSDDQARPLGGRGYSRVLGVLGQFWVLGRLANVVRCHNRNGVWCAVPSRHKPSRTAPCDPRRPTSPTHARTHTRTHARTH